jgi:hypothetical protein
MEQSFTLERKGKRNTIYCRMDEEMIGQLFALRKSSGISVSEIVRESVRRLIEDAKMEGTINLSL